MASVNVAEWEQGMSGVPYGQSTLLNAPCGGVNITAAMLDVDLDPPLRAFKTLADGDLSVVGADGVTCILYDCVAKSRESFLIKKINSTGTAAAIKAVKSGTHLCLIGYK